jgi:hypothetical protein
MDDFSSVKFTLLAEMTRWALAQAALPPDSDPLTLAESPLGLNFALMPVQGLLLNLVGSSWRGKVTLRRNRKALKDLLGYGAGNEQRLWLPPGVSVEARKSCARITFESPITLLNLDAGRRSGKTTLSAILSAWLARRILLDPAFLEGVPILRGSIISILNVAPEAEQAKILFRMLVSNLETLGLMKSGREPSDTVSISNLLIESLNSSSRSVRGRTAVCISIDELAHFIRTAGPLADRQMWIALMPSLATFDRKSLAVVTTTPAGRSGVAWELFMQRGEREGMLTARLPSWILNPHVSKESLEPEFERDEYSARQEYGAEFLAPEKQFLRTADIRACIRTSDCTPPKNARYHLHVDLGLIHDATALALGFLEHDEETDSRRVVIERVDVMKGSPESPVNVNEIEKRIISISESVNLGGVTFDQHQSAYLVERLKASGINAGVFAATPKSNREAYAYLRDLITTCRISLPDHDLLITELEHLECSSLPDGFKVEASSGFSDDCADAVACCAWFLSIDSSQDWKDIFGIMEP